MPKNKIAAATILSLATMFISGVSVFVNKFAISAVKDPVLFATLKNSLVAVCLFGAVILFGKFKEIRLLSRSQWARLFAVGIVGGALPFVLFFTGLAQTSAVNGALIHKTLFLWVALLAIPFLKESMVWQQWTAIAFVFVGNLFVGGFTGFNFNAGEIMILAATILWAIENIIAKKVLADVSSVTVSAARMVIGSLLLILYSAFFGDFNPIFSLTSTQWGWTILTSVLLAGYVFTWYSALARAPATYVATLLVPATIVTNMLSSLFITHTMSGRDFISISLYSVGLVMFILFTRKTLSATLTAKTKAFSTNH